MLRLPRFTVVVPNSISELVATLGEPGARIVSGGTDLLPNLKHRFEAPPLLVSTAQLSEHRRIRIDEGALVIGAGATLTEVAESELVQIHGSSLAEAASRVASPLIRNSATIGGNVNLDTRCRYVNQTEFWRSAIGGCLKSNGDVCHVVPKGRSCVAAMSSDCVPPLTTLDAVLVQRSIRGQRLVPISEHYLSDGIRHIAAPVDELTCEIRIPVSQTPRRLAYAKWAVRESIDFPLISVAMRFDLEADRDDAPITDARIVVGVLAAKPKSIRTAALVGRRLTDPSTHELITTALHKQAKPLPNVPYDPAYRRKVLPVFALRALKSTIASA